MNTEDKTNPLHFLVSDSTNPETLQRAINIILASGNSCVVWQPPTPFLYDYFPYPQLPIHAKEYPTPQGVTINDQK